MSKSFLLILYHSIQGKQLDDYLGKENPMNRGKVSKHNTSNVALRDCLQKVVHSIISVHVEIILLQSWPSAAAFFGREALL